MTFSSFPAGLRAHRTGRSGRLPRSRHLWGDPLRLGVSGRSQTVAPGAPSASRTALDLQVVLPAMVPSCAESTRWPLVHAACGRTPRSALSGSSLRLLGGTGIARKDSRACSWILGPRLRPCQRYESGRVETCRRLGTAAGRSCWCAEAADFCRWAALRVRRDLAGEARRQRVFEHAGGAPSILLMAESTGCAFAVIPGLLDETRSWRPRRSHRSR